MTKKKPCEYCRKKKKKLTWDHVVSKSKGGKWKVRVCSECNCQKSDLSLTEFLRTLPGDAPQREWVPAFFAGERQERKRIWKLEWEAQEEKERNEWHSIGPRRIRKKLGPETVERARMKIAERHKEERSRLAEDHKEERSRLSLC